MADRYYKNTLLAEGKDDVHVLRNLLQAQTISSDIVGQGKIEKDTIAVHNMDGITKLLDQLPVYMSRGEIERLGIVVDADLNIEARWQSVRHIILQSGSGHVPTIPEPAGTVVDIEQTGRKLTVGIWLMPDNQLPGILEDFVSYLVPAEDLLWGRAKECVATIPEGERRFSEGNIRKAEIHTWLAWQKEPGTPLGQAITARYLDSAAPHAQQFVKWVHRLFGLA